MNQGLLLIHAFPLDSSMWEDQVSALQNDVPVVAPDLPGFGQAPPDGDVMTMEVAAARCAEALDEAKLDRAVVCGLSIGGYIALELWRRHRARFAGLVLANTKAEADAEEGKRRREQLAALVREKGTESILQGMRTLISAGASAELWDRVAAVIRKQRPDAIAAASLGMAARADSRPDLPGIDVPTLVITSTGEQLIPPDVTSPMADVIPDARLEVIEGAGHLSNMEASGDFNRALQEHLGRCGLL
jgi:3-oxoadipate enol-lactonase